MSANYYFIDAFGDSGCAFATYPHLICASDMSVLKNIARNEECSVGAWGGYPLIGRNGAVYYPLRDVGQDFALWKCEYNQKYLLENLYCRGRGEDGMMLFFDADISPSFIDEMYSLGTFESHVVLQMLPEWIERLKWVYCVLGRDHDFAMVMSSSKYSGVIDRTLRSCIANHIAAAPLRWTGGVWGWPWE